MSILTDLLGGGLTWLAAIGGILIAIFTAWFSGKKSGKAKAEQEATERETAEKIQASQAVAKRQSETAKEASDVKDNVTRMPGSAVDDELRSDWINKD